MKAGRVAIVGLAAALLAPAFGAPLPASAPTPSVAAAAAVPRVALVVGNGGLSFRRRQTFEDAARRLPELVPAHVLEESNEDAVWSYYARELGLRLAPEDQAASAFFDLREDRDLDSNLNTCIGIHGLKHEMHRANAAIRQEAERRGVSRG